MARSWKEAKELAAEKNRPCVYHNRESGEYGACTPEGKRRRAVSSEGFRDDCVCFPAGMNPEEMEVRERLFLEGDPGWRGSDGCGRGQG